MIIQRRRKGGIVPTSALKKNFLRRYTTIAGLAILVAIPGLRPAAAAEGVALGYEGYLGGLHMLTLEVELVSSDTNYRMETKTKGRGIVGWLFNWASNAVTEGEVRPDGTLRPRWHERDILRPGKKAKMIQIEYNDDGIPRIARMRVGGEANFREDTKRRGTIDPISAVLAVMDQMTAGTACEGVFPVFDGKERYDATALTGKSKSLKGNKYMMHKGVATRCDLVLKTVEEKKKPAPRRNPHDPQPPKDDTMVLTLWFASPAEGMPSVPVLATADLEWGGVRLYLARAENAIISPEGKRAEAK